MVVGVCEITLFMRENSSLKDKRRIIKGIIGRTRRNFEISIAETGDHDLLQKGKIGFAITGNDNQVVNSVIDRVIDFIDGSHEAEVLESNFDIFHF
ncbi:MAG: DUF503 domain-containing protein [Deltaproteobacteria bacterium]|nr:DUF503 domain-containing protein [Deltaproteobacteria bacterium]